MLRDGRSVPDGTTLKTDLCVVGAGVAGTTLTQELIGEAADVMLLESGDLQFTKSLRDLPAVLRRHVRGEQQFTGGRNVGQPYYPLRFTRARAVGGSTRAWAHHGLQARPLDPIDLDARPDLPLFGWPIDLAELEPLYRRAQQVCALGPYAYDAVDWESPQLGHPLPLDDKRVRSEIFQFGHRSSFDRYAPDFERAGNINLLPHATVAHIAADRAGRVTGLDCVSLSGNRFRVEARTYVLATGAIETSRLLLASNDVHPAGIGNGGDLVGRYFMEHPDIEVGFFVPHDDLDARELRLYERQDVDDDFGIRAMLRLNDDVIRAEGLLNAAVRLRSTHHTGMEPAILSARTLRRSVHFGVPTPHLVRHATTIVGGTRHVLRHRAVKRSGARPDVFGLEMMAEQVPDPSSRVRLGTRRDRLGLPRTYLDWRIQQIDWKSMRRTVEIMGEDVADAGVGRIVSTLGDASAAPAVFGNWHHLGTTRMHPDRAQGVVDEHSRVHEMENLYVAGGSVFPTGGCSNPTLTIAALALRLADHLRKQLAA